MTVELWGTVPHTATASLTTPPASHVTGQRLPLKRNEAFAAFLYCGLRNELVYLTLQIATAPDPTQPYPSLPYPTPWHYPTLASLSRWYSSTLCSRTRFVCCVNGVLTLNEDISLIHTYVCVRVCVCVDFSRSSFSCNANKCEFLELENGHN